MKTNSSIARTANPNTRASHFRTVYAARLLTLLLLLTLPAAVQAQFNITINNGSITITGYTGSGGDVTIPSSILVNGVSLPVTSIGDYAFSVCTSLANVTIPDSVTNIGDDAFNYCISVTHVTIGNGVSSIGKAAFVSCWNLTSVTIGNSVTSIGDYAFLDCSGLTSIYFKGNAPDIGSYVFDGDNNATVYYLPEPSGWEKFAQLTGFTTVLWKPQVQSDGSFGGRANQFGFNINWTSGQIIVVEACTDLANPVWQPVQTNLLTADSLYFSDPDWTNYPGRFYRLRSP
jgi:hypothetical protein